MNKIALHGVPRSGTSWLGSIFDSCKTVAYRHQPLFSYAFKAYLDNNSNKDDIDKFYKELLDTTDDFILQKKEKQAGAIPKFEKEHIKHIVYKEARYHYILENLLLKDDLIKVIGIVRDPKSVIYSWYNAPKEFNKGKWNLLEEWKEAKKKNDGRKENYYGYKKWKEVTFLFLKLQNLFPKRFMLINYNDLLDNTEILVKEMFEFTGIEYSEQTQDYLNLSKSIDKSQDAYSVYRINQSDSKWKNRLPKAIIDYINLDLKDTELSKFIN